MSQTEFHMLSLKVVSVSPRLSSSVDSTEVTVTADFAGKPEVSSASEDLLVYISSRQIQRFAHIMVLILRFRNPINDNRIGSESQAEFEG
jgi:hypothetical protein